MDKNAEGKENWYCVRAFDANLVHPPACSSAAAAFSGQSLAGLLQRSQGEEMFVPEDASAPHDPLMRLPPNRTPRLIANTANSNTIATAPNMGRTPAPDLAGASFFEVDDEMIESA